MRHFSKSYQYFFVVVVIFGTLVVLSSVRAQMWDGDSKRDRQETRRGKLHFRNEKTNTSVCEEGGEGMAACHAKVVVDQNGLPATDEMGITPDASSGPAGYGPSDLLSAYRLGGYSMTHRIAAVVVAYDHPNIYSDLNTYSTYFGLPKLSDCPVSNGSLFRPCFQKISQNGRKNYPQSNSTWALEAALDVETLHAICQNCSILLVEAKSNKWEDLLAAEDQARYMGATVISNSWGAPEFSGETSFDSHFNYQGVAFTFSTGDNGYGVQYPAASKYVTAVGGTKLSMSGGNYLSESAWNNSGSGCSAYESRPVFQALLNLSGCPNRSTADVSAVADPTTGAAIYDSFPYNGKKGWFQVGGTSLSSPIIAGAYALGGVSNSVFANSIPYYIYRYDTNLRDVNLGSNGLCGTAYLCQSLAGYDGPTGLGTPLTVQAF